MFFTLWSILVYTVQDIDIGLLLTFGDDSFQTHHVSKVTWCQCSRRHMFCTKTINWNVESVNMTNFFYLPASNLAEMNKGEKLKQKITFNILRMEVLWGAKYYLPSNPMKNSSCCLLYTGSAEATNSFNAFWKATSSSKDSFRRLPKKKDWLFMTNQCWSPNCRISAIQYTCSAKKDELVLKCSVINTGTCFIIYIKYNLLCIFYIKKFVIFKADPGP